MQIYQKVLVFIASDTFQLTSLELRLLEIEVLDSLEGSLPSGRRPIDSGLLRKIINIGIATTKAYRPKIL